MTEIEKISTKKIFVHIWTKNSVKNLTKWIFFNFFVQDCIPFGQYYGLWERKWLFIIYKKEAT